MDEKYLERLCRLIRYNILTSTTEAGSGHPTSSLSAVELMTTLFFGGFYKEHDRFILSKGHASPLLYSLYHAGGLISKKELMTLRKFGSRLEGHPNPRLSFVDVATGSLGQGLSVGVGMALGMRLKSKNSKVWVLLGDSEMAEGQVWEAMEIASYYKLNNLVGIIDVNRLGQYGETEEGWKINHYAKKAEAFGWEAIVVRDGHDLKEVYKAYNTAQQRNHLSHKSLSRKHRVFLESEKNLLSSPNSSKPIMIIAKTIKGKGVSFLENKNGWHGKALNKEELKLALKELGKVDFKIRGKINIPTTGVEDSGIPSGRKFVISEKDIINKINNVLSSYQTEETEVMSINGKESETSLVATREAYGDALVTLGEENPNIVVLDADVANSTYENKFQQKFPDRFFEMFIAEENMMSVALGLSKMGYIPFVSTFAAFLTQTFDQVRMAQYSKANLKIVGSHAGVSIGQDGPSQMGLEDLAMFRSILNSIVFYPSDSTSAQKLTKLMAETLGITYMRTTRGKTPVIYDEKEEFKIGGLKVHKVNKVFKVHKEKVLIIAAGITLHESLKAQQKLAEEGIETVIVDLYCIKPLSSELASLIKEYKNIIIVEDHYPSGGIGEAVSKFIVNEKLKIENWKHLCVKKIPMSGTPEELLRFEEISSNTIIKMVLSCQKK